MTATVENLTEKIERLRIAIQEIEERGEDPHNIKIEMDRLVRDLNQKRQILREGRSVLND